MRIAIAGASGFVGRALTARLAAAGHEVVALSRSTVAVPPGATAVAVDVSDEAAATAALAGVDMAYYLVHSLATGPSFRELDRRLAETFGRAAATAGARRLVYVGGLGEAPSSAHLASRHEVGAALRGSGLPVVELRAAVVFGAGGISFEMLRYLTERLPFMVCPRWVRTRIQPIALADLLAYLEQSVDVEPGIYEVGGADVTTYEEMILEYARVRGLHRRRIVDIPWLTPRLSSYWVDLVTPVDQAVSHALIESLVTEVVVTDPDPSRRAFTVTPMSVRDALRSALDDQDLAVTATLFDRHDGLADGVYTVTEALAIPGDRADAVGRDLARIGGSFGWYGAAAGWVLRVALGRLVGEHLRRRRAAVVAAGASVDWWRVARVEPGVLVLRSDGWFPGDAWLGYRAGPDRLLQVAAFRPAGVPGFLYWKLLVPVHRVAFGRMARRRVSPRG
ncbi:MAG TPA: DUF2867 domain-containing protein [Acidimicrobiales bacterium]|nr:DUF2867 domain-containing protein [Acidimicrobiales bacterium]